MQNPEVWQFEEAPASFTVRECQDFAPFDSAVKRFSFAHLVAIVIPDCLRLPPALVKPLTDDCEYYKIDKLNLSELVNLTFLKCFVKNGEFSLLSIGNRIDCDNCCAVTADGFLVLSLTKDTYQSFGLEGLPSHFSKRNKDRYVVKIQLNEPKLGKREKYRKALATLPSFAAIFSWRPPESTTICPSSVAKYFADLNYDVTLCQPDFRSHVTYSIAVPALSLAENDAEAHARLVDFAEWFGVVALEGSFGNAADYVNSAEGPEGNEGQCRVLIWRGFYRSDSILSLLRMIQQYNKEENKECVAAYVQGFSDAPILEGGDEQNYYTHGDNGNLYVIKNDKFWLCKMRVSGKQLK